MNDFTPDFPRRWSAPVTAATLAACTLLCLGSPSIGAAEPTVIHVLPAGEDAWSGRLPEPNAQRSDGPVGSLDAARDAVRRLRTEGYRGPVEVRVAGGLYQLDRPWLLEPEDSGTAEGPVVYAAASNEKPVFSGGRIIEGMRARDDGLWEADIPAVADGRWYFEQLWVNGRRAVRARSPNRSFHHFTEVEERSLDESAPANPRARPAAAEQSLGVSDEVISILAALSEEELRDVNLLAYHKWDNTRRRVDRVDSEAEKLITRGQGMKPWNPLVKDTPFILENFRAALDEAGEWFLERSGKLLYYPRDGETPEQCEFIAPAVEPLVIVRGDAASGRFVEHIRLQGLCFRHGQWLTPDEGVEPAQAAAPIEAAVMLDGARNVTLNDCEVTNVGTYAVWFRRGCSDCRIERCFIEDVGAGGIRIGETSIASDERARTAKITVDNNILRGGGRIFPCAVGIWIGQSGDNRVTHNDVGDFFYTGISAGWRWGYDESLAKRNRIGFNRVHHIGQGVLSDMGGIYTLGPSEGTVVHDNVFHDIHSATYGGWGLYTDEGSTGILFENNLVYRTKSGGFHQHYGRENVIRNNILAFAKDQQLQATRVEDHLSFTFERNIVYFDQGDLFNPGWARVKSETANNCYWHPSGEVDFGEKTLQQRQAEGHDLGSIVADPGFVNPAEDDFRFSDESVVKQIGFEPFDASKAGVRGEGQWRERAARYPWPEPKLPPAEP